MRRRQLVELEDLLWFPRVIRDGGTDWLAFMANNTKVFSVVAPKIRRAMEATGTSNVLDLCAGGGGQLDFERRSIDAADVPPDLDGVRTMFNAFHHFPPAAARAILVDPVRKGRGIAVFEGANHRGIALVAIPLQLPAMLLFTPFVRPFRWSRLLFTYVLPLIPLLVLFDGFVSFLRIYGEDELRELVAEVPGHDRFAWDIDSTTVPGMGIGLLHLVGIPR